MKTEYKLLLKPSDVVPSHNGWYVSGALNPGAVRLPSKKILLAVRVAEVAGKAHEQMKISPHIVSETEYAARYEKIKKADVIAKGKHGEIYLADGTCRLPTLSHIRKVILSEDGLHVESIDEEPLISGIPIYSEYGVEDPRITVVNGIYYMTYVGVSGKEGVSTYLASSKDCKKWKRNGIIFREQNKDVCLFPEKIKGRYVALNRPESSMSFSRPGIWISYSKDLKYWGDDVNLMRPRGSRWESTRIGGGTPPIKTKKGWLLLYHGVMNNGNGNVYSAGAALLDLKNPEKIIARSPTNRPLFRPDKKYEQNGFLDNVIFPTGVVPHQDGKHLLVYAGGADSITSVRKIQITRILKHMTFT